MTGILPSTLTKSCMFGQIEFVFEVGWWNKTCAEGRKEGWVGGVSTHLGVIQSRNAPKVSKSTMGLTPSTVYLIYTHVGHHYFWIIPMSHVLLTRTRQWSLFTEESILDVFKCIVVTMDVYQINAHEETGRTLFVSVCHSWWTFPFNKAHPVRAKLFPASECNLGFPLNGGTYAVLLGHLCGFLPPTPLLVLAGGFQYRLLSGSVRLPAQKLVGFSASTWHNHVFVEFDNV